MSNLPVMGNLVAGEWRDSAETVVNINPYTGEGISRSSQASTRDIEAAALSAQRAFELTRRRPHHARAAILRRAAALLTERKEEFAALMTAELGRPRRFNEIEAERGVFTLNLCAEEALRQTGEYLPLDAIPSAENRYAYWRREAVGPVIAISPFNFPVNLLLHKIGPAIAAGCTVSAKIPPQTPDTPRKLGELLMDAGCVPGEINLFDCPAERAEAAVRDERYKLLSFTGSARVGWKLKSIAGKKRVLLELGNAGACVVHHDVKDLDWVVRRVLLGAFAAAGQVCIKVQRVYVHERIYAHFERRFVDAVANMKWGDPSSPETIMGPVVDDASAVRIESWIGEAVKGGAALLAGGTREGRMVAPTVLANVAPEMKVACEEVFGPVVSLWSYGDGDEIFGSVNATAFGLQAGVFTDSIEFMERAVDGCDVAAVCVNEYPMFRVDHMPYGGIKDSGLGREGPRYAMDEYTEKKLVVVNRVPRGT